MLIITVDADKESLCCIEVDGIVEYSKTPVLLKRYSFISKMAICQNLSRKIMKYTKLDFITKRNAIYPWELEVFALFSLMTIDEYDSKIFNDNDKVLNEDFNAIR